MEVTRSHRQEWGRIGSARRAAILQDARDRADRFEAECIRLRAQKTALIAFARGKGTTAEEIVSLLAVDDVTPLAAEAQS